MTDRRGSGATFESLGGDLFGMTTADGACSIIHAPPRVYYFRGAVPPLLPLLLREHALWRPYMFNWCAWALCQPRNFGVVAAADGHLFVRGLHICCDDDEDDLCRRYIAGRVRVQPRVLTRDEFGRPTSQLLADGTVQHVLHWTQFPDSWWQPGEITCCMRWGFRTGVLMYQP